MARKTSSHRKRPTPSTGGEGRKMRVPRPTSGLKTSEPAPTSSLSSSSSSSDQHQGPSVEDGNDENENDQHQHQHQPPLVDTPDASLVHPPNCNCLLRRPGLFLPPSLLDGKGLEDEQMENEKA